MHFDVGAVTEGVGLVRALDHEAEPPVERDARYVVGVDRQLQPAQGQPFVGRLHRRVQQRRADPSAGPGIVDTNPDPADMRPPSRETIEARVADQLLADRRDEVQRSVPGFSNQALTSSGVWNGSRKVPQR